ncbi:MAG: response regulator transcription factor [Pseudonocardiales bacterium]|nr:response regulator transcription factor [Pseudonocardiales bacterium]
MRIIVAEDHVFFREGLVNVLTDFGHDVIAQFPDTEMLAEQVCADVPDLVILDVRMPPTHTTEGLKAAQQIRASFPEMGILVLSAHVETQYLGKLIADSPGYIGYILKDRVANFDEFFRFTRDIIEGKSVIDQTVVKDLLNRANNRAALARLTDRERKVLELMATGRSNKAIAGRLSLSRRSVESAVSDVFNKLDLPDREDDQRRVLAVITYLQS